MFQYSTPLPAAAGHLSRKRRLSFTVADPPAMLLMRTPPWDHNNDVTLPPPTATTTLISTAASPIMSPHGYVSHPRLEIYPDSPASCPDNNNNDEEEDDDAASEDSDVITTTSAVVDDDDSLEPASKIPRHVGTIYEERLAPLSPVTTLPVNTNTATQTAVSNSNQRATDSAAQRRLLQLVMAKGGGDEAALESFLAAHAHSVDINQYDAEEGVTPLQRLCQQAGGSVAVARILVRYGADVRLTSRDGWSPLHMASFAGNNQLVMYLLRCPK
jgi:ankyrin repeat protein